VLSGKDNLLDNEAPYLAVPLVGHFTRGGRCLDQRRYVLKETLTKISPNQSHVDHEIFRLRDEMANTEGLNVTFYGTKPSVPFISE
jgi:hypothetical protein